jgi:DNA topoisomerase-1
LRELGKHPEDEQPVAIYEGRYGPYVKHGKINATIPSSSDPASVTLDEAVALIAARAAKAGGGKKKIAKKAASPNRKSKSRKPKKPKSASPDAEPTSLADGNLPEPVKESVRD